MTDKTKNETEKFYKNLNMCCSCIVLIAIFLLTLIIGGSVASQL